MWHHLAKVQDLIPAGLGMGSVFGYYCGASILMTWGMMWYLRSKHPNGGVMVMVHRLIDTLIVLGGPITWPYVLYRTCRVYARQRHYLKRSHLDFDVEKQE